MRKFFLVLIVIITAGVLYSQIIAKFDNRFINPQELLFSDTENIEEDSFLLTQIYGSPVLTRDSSVTFNIHHRLYSPDSKYNIVESLSLFVHKYEKSDVIYDNLAVFAGDIAPNLLDYSKRPINLEYIKEKYLLKYENENLNEYFSSNHKLNSLELIYPKLNVKDIQKEEFSDLNDFNLNDYNFTYLLYENSNDSTQTGLIFSFPFIINDETHNGDSYVIYNLTTLENKETGERSFFRSKYEWVKRINEINIQSAYETASEGFIQFHRYPDATESYLPLFEDALKMNPESPEGLAAYGNYFLYEGITAKASELITRAVELNPDLDSPIVLKAYGALLFSEDNFIQAKEAFQKSIEIDPDFPYSLRNLSFINIKDGDINTAVENLEKAVELDPQWIYPWTDLASLYYLRRDYDKSKDIYLRIILKRPDLIKPYIYTGTIYRKEGKLKASEIYLKKALLINPNDWLANFNMGYLFEIQEDLERSSFYYSRYDKLKIQNKESFYNDFWYSNPFIDLSIKLNIGLYDILDFKVENLKIYLDGPIYLERYYEDIQAGTLFQFELVDIPSGQYIFKAVWGKKKVEEIIDIAENSHLVYTIY